MFCSETCLERPQPWETTFLEGPHLPGRKVVVPCFGTTESPTRDHLSWETIWCSLSKEVLLYRFCSRTCLERPLPLAIKVRSVKAGGLWWQVQLHWNVGASDRTLWSFKTDGLSWHGVSREVLLYSNTVMSVRWSAVWQNQRFLAGPQPATISTVCQWELRLPSQWYHIWPDIPVCDLPLHCSQQDRYNVSTEFLFSKDILKKQMRKASKFLAANNVNACNVSPHQRDICNRGNKGRIVQQ